MPKLFAVYLGGKAPGATIEVHDITFVVAEDVRSAFPQLREKWFGDKKSVHVDAWAELREVAGHRISLVRKSVQGPKLFFVNVGYYEKKVFAEQHRFHFLVADSRDAAKARAKKLYPAGTDQPHLDNVVEIDDLVEVGEVDGYFLKVEPAKAAEFRFENVYWPMRG